MRFRGLGGLVGAAVAIALGASAGASSSHQPDPVTCSNQTGHHTLSVRMRDKVERFRVPPRFLDQLPPGTPAVIVDRTPAEATIERRIDEVTVLDETASDDDSFFGESDGAPRSCGPAPTVANTDTVRVDLGKHSEAGELYLNLQYGPLAPGFTDEGDGSSEIELDARLGEGYAVIVMTRGSDAVAVQRPESGAGPVRINLNAGETSPDFDLSVGGKSGLGVVGGGGDDELTSSGIGNTEEGEDPYELFGLFLEGGQGADTLTGGNGTEFLFGGPGADRIEAGGGMDLVVAYGHAPDRIDCGPGQDYVLVTRPGNRLSRCEVVEEEDDLFSRPTPRKILHGKRFPRLLQRR